MTTEQIGIGQGGGRCTTGRPADAGRATGRGLPSTNCQSHDCAAPADHCETCDGCPGDGDCGCREVDYRTEEGELTTEMVRGVER